MIGVTLRATDPYQDALLFEHAYAYVSYFISTRHFSPSTSTLHAAVSHHCKLSHHSDVIVKVSHD